MYKRIFDQIPDDVFVRRKEKAFSLYSWVHVTSSDFFFNGIVEGETRQPTPCRICHFAIRVLSSFSAFPLSFCQRVRLPLRNNRT